LGRRIMKIAIDLDHTINASDQSIEFFRVITNLLSPDNEIYIITNRETGTEKEISEELSELGIQYHHIVITPDKAEFIKENDITIYFENTDEYFLQLGEGVTVFKIRESGNFDFAEKKWIGSRKTMKMIDEE